MFDCVECTKVTEDSFLFLKFDLKICDQCRMNDFVNVRKFNETLLEKFNKKKEKKETSKDENIKLGDGFFIEEEDEDHDENEFTMSKDSDFDEIDENAPGVRFYCGNDYRAKKLEDQILTFTDIMAKTEVEESIVNFNDSFKSRQSKYSLITKTNAKEIYLLSDSDIERREPILKFALKPNPHNQNWQSMKLYLRSEIEERALRIWKTFDNITSEKEKRKIRRRHLEKKKQIKKIKRLKVDTLTYLRSKSDNSKKCKHENMKVIETTVEELKDTSYFDRTDVENITIKKCENCEHTDITESFW
ncbi:hypothetical protein SNEBB_006447 [Seison nebaliae]|nr:hypothetical protein SNEBB_006447 [Seison nebaliae]